MHYKLGCEEEKGLDHIMYDDDDEDYGEEVEAVEAAMRTAKSAAWMKRKVKWV